jgi:hypothetical protein
MKKFMTFLPWTALLGLQTAARDFCGHRKNAVHECDEALRQLQKALDCDRN